MTAHLHPVNGTTAEEITASVEGLVVSDGVVVVDATLLGPEVAAAERVVAVMRRAASVVAERSSPTGIRRVVRLRGSDVEVADAGARQLPSGAWAFPPEDPDGVAASLADRLGRPVVLALRTADGAVALTRSSHTRWAHALALSDAPAVVVETCPHATGPHATGPRGHEAHAADGCPEKGDGRGLRHEHGPHRGPADDHTDDGADTDRNHADEGRDELRAAGFDRPVGGYETVRAAYGVHPGTPEAIDVGLPASTGDDIEARVDRACRLALRPLPEVSAWHPLARLLRTRVDIADVRATTLQIGIRLEAADDFVLGIVVGRLLPALGAEGLSGVVIEHETTRAGVTAVVGLMTDA